MADSTHGVLPQICLLANAAQENNALPPIPLVGGGKSQAFAEWLREALSESSGGSIDFSEPVEEDKDWDILATCGEQQFCIAVSFLASTPLAGAEWVVTVLPDVHFKLLPKQNDAGSKSEAKTLNLLCELIRKVSEQRGNVIVLGQMAGAAVLGSPRLKLSSGHHHAADRG